MSDPRATGRTDAHADERADSSATDIDRRTP